MRRTLLYALVLLFVAIAAIASYRIAHQTIVVGRANADAGPPPGMRMPPTAPNMVGQPVPRFMTVDLNGAPVSADALRGRVLLLDVWATWCKPCREEMPRLEQEVWRKHQTDVAVVAVARGENADKVRAFNQQAGLTFTLVPDPRQTLSHQFGGNAPIPRLYLVGRNGIVVDQHIGYGEESFKNLVANVEQEIAK